MSESNIFPGYDSVEAYCKDVLKATFTCARVANTFDHSLFDYYNTFKDFRTAITREKDSLLSLMNGLISSQNLGADLTSMDVEEQHEFLKETNAILLENVSYLLDETEGEKKPDVEIVEARKPYLLINTSWNKKQFAGDKTPDKLTLIGAKNISRPQLSFKDKVDNTEAIFMPIIKEKPNSIKPLAILVEENEEGEEEFCHPYEVELEKFQPAADQFVICEPKQPLPIEETPVTYVNTPEQLKNLCEELRGVSEFALDVEHHSYRTFQGISCLLQISTRQKDYLIDGIELRSDLWILNEVLTDPKITKVFHGADMDILWLQRDFGLYVVNMFDTGQAARVLNFAHLSLAFLIKHFCNIELNKQYQLADWRIRPLPAELQNYAREDTHYLLYVFDNLKNQLLTEGNKFHNLLHSVYERSKAVCLKRYKKLVFHEERYLEFYKKSKKHFSARQLYCLKELYAWRDKVARVEDESYGYVLPNHMLLQICENLPREHQGILACCHPVPPLVQQQLLNLHTMVTKANNSPLTQLAEAHQDVTPTSEKMSSVDLNDKLHCPHDIHAYDDLRAHLHHSPETKQNNSKLAVPIKIKTVLFGKDISCTEGDKLSREIAEQVSKENKTIFERYLLTQKYNAAHGPEEIENEAVEKVEEPEKPAEEEIEVVIEPAPVVPAPEVILLDSDSDKNETDVPVMMEKHLTKKQRRNLKKQEKRKFQAANAGSSVEDYRPSKKSRTPDRAAARNQDSSFTPFDYSSVYANFSKEASSTPKGSHPPHQNKSPHSQNSKSSMRRQKKNRGKQGSFNAGRSWKNSNARNWPKMQ